MFIADQRNFQVLLRDPSFERLKDLISGAIGVQFLNFSYSHSCMSFQPLMSSECRLHMTYRTLLTNA